MAPTTGYKANAPLPGGASVNTYVRIKGLPGGIWQAASSPVNTGDGTDNPELQSRVTLIPADCASLTFSSIINQSPAEFTANGNSGTINVDATATAGTALWLRGFEYTGDMADVPLDDPGTVQNEAIEYLKLHGAVVFDLLIVGPFQFGPPNCPLIIPFNLVSGDLLNLVFTTDAVGKSNPLILNQPSNVNVTCADPVVYPPLTYSGCGPVTATYAPPQGSTLPEWALPPVLVTITDTNGNTANATFKVTVTETTPRPAVPVLTLLSNQCSVQVPTPTTTSTCGATIKTVNGTTSDPTNYTAQGTFTVHWSFNDGNGNVSTANQTVIVKDTIPPVVPVLPPVKVGCLMPVTLTAPTTTDNCAGTVTGTTSTQFPITGGVGDDGGDLDI